MQPGEVGEKDYWQHDDESLAAQLPHEDMPNAETQEPVSWQASEAIHHEKHALWFVGLIVVAIILFVISIFLIQSWTFAALVVVMTVAAIVIGGRPPRVVSYNLTPQGIKINDKTFSLHDFRAFGLLREGALYSIVLLPHKRFMPSVNVYFPAENGEQIVDIFGMSLPMEHIEPDLVDKISRALRF